METQIRNHPWKSRHTSDTSSWQSQVMKHLKTPACHQDWHAHLSEKKYRIALLRWRVCQGACCSCGLVAAALLYWRGTFPQWIGQKLWPITESCMSCWLGASLVAIALIMLFCLLPLIKLPRVATRFNSKLCI